MRPDYDIYFMRIAEVVSSRSTCAKKKVGCVIVSSTNRILSTGYNGVPEGETHCTEYWKDISEMYERHREWSAQHEIHAEENAIRYAQLPATDTPPQIQEPKKKPALFWRLFLNCASDNVQQDVTFTNLVGCTLYTTYAPCMRCAQLILDARISRVVYRVKNIRSSVHVEEMFGARGVMYHQIMEDERSE